MKIHEHAIDRYIKRILEIDQLEQVTPQERESYREILRDTAENPDRIHDEKKNVIIEGDKLMPEIRIKGDVAVPVDDGVVPTAYCAETFDKRVAE